MEKTYKCLICLDSGYLASLYEDPSIVVPMLSVGGGLEDYGLSLCSCQIKTEAEKLEETATKLKKQMESKFRRRAYEKRLANCSKDD